MDYISGIIGMNYISFVKDVFGDTNNLLMHIKDTFKVGNRVRLAVKQDSFSSLLEGDEGVITGIDPSCNLVVEWSDGHTENIKPFFDEFWLLEESECS